MNSLFASTARGLEELLKTELEGLGATDCQVVQGGVIIAVAVVIQAGLLIILLPRQTDKLLQVLRVLFSQQVAPFIIFCAPFCCPVRADKRQRQAAIVAVVEVDYSQW